METQAQAQQNGAKVSVSPPFDRAVDASRQARMAALEVARQMRVDARNEMKVSRSARKRAAIKNARLAEFVANCERLGIDMEGAEVPQPASDNSQSGKDQTSNGNGNKAVAAEALNRAEASAA